MILLIKASFEFFNLFLFEDSFTQATTERNRADHERLKFILQVTPSLSSPGAYLMKVSLVESTPRS